MSTLTLRPCFICLNEVQTLSSGAGETEIDSSSAYTTFGIQFTDKISQKFTKLATHYLNLKSVYLKPTRSHKRKHKQSRATVEMQICEYCVPLAKSVCETFELWYSIQNELNLRLEEIAKIIQSNTIINGDNQAEASTKRNLGNNPTKMGKLRRDFVKEFEKKKRTCVENLVNLDKNEENNEAVFDVPHENFSGSRSDGEEELMLVTSQLKIERDEFVEDALCTDDDGFNIRLSYGENFTKVEAVDPLEAPVIIESSIKTIPSCNTEFSISQREDVIDTQKPYHRPRQKTKRKLLQEFECIFCQSILKGLHRLEIHLRKHISEKPYSCRYCSIKCFTSRSSLLRHEMLHGSGRGGEKIFLCSKCPKQFRILKSLQLHMRTHNGSRVDLDPPHLCGFCGKCFDDKRKLWRHEQIHSTVKPFKCRYCEKSFRESANRDRHEILHTGEKSFKCGTCYKTFADPSSQRVHEQQMHNKTFREGEKIYNCSFCGKRLTSQTQLDRHERVHTNVRPYKCTLCETAFKRASHLKAHEKLHAGFPGETRLDCIVCGKKYQQFTKRIRHEQKAHGIPTPL